LRAQVIVLAGPSGSGKSRLCSRLTRHLGLPELNLDDFYKDGSDPSLPRLQIAPGQEIVDWDDPASWHCGDAAETLERLCREGFADVPIYEISRDGRVGYRRLDIGDAPYVVAEGIFAQEVVAACRERGILADAICVANPRLVTFWRRLTRDLREHRKPPFVLLRRGLRLMRAQPQVVAHAVELGCTPMTSEQAFQRIATLVGSPARR
jgi:uridine kinase